MRERLGLRRCRYASSGAAPIAPEVLEFFIGIGVPVYELYGMTENSAVATGNFVGRMKLGTVGEPYEGIGFRIDEVTGEIQTKHDGVFAGYWNKPDKTAETFTEDGWLMTGDVGEWVDGTHVRIVDRIKHIIITSGGKNISPSEIENSLKTSPYIKEAMVVGDGASYITALIGIELDTVGNWALRRGIPYTTYRDLSEKPEVIELIGEVVKQTNERFARVENIRQFRLIPKELDHEDGELTATQKLKRNSMMDRVRRARGVDVPMTAALQRRFDVSKDLPLLFLGAAMVPVTVLLIIELIQDPTVFFQTLMKALALGSVYAIIALGFVLDLQGDTDRQLLAGRARGWPARCSLSLPDRRRAHPVHDAQEPDRQHRPAMARLAAVRVRGAGRRRRARARHRAPGDPADGR